MADLELEAFKRDLSLLDYAQKAGFEHRPREGAPGLTVLQHPNRDAIVVGQNRDGQWLYASVLDGPPRAPGETAAQTAERLRACVARTQDKGSIVEFVQHRDWTARTREVPLDVVRERLREFQADGVRLDDYGALCPPGHGHRPPHARDPAISIDGEALAGSPRVLGPRPRERNGEPVLHPHLTEGPRTPPRFGDSGVQERLTRGHEAQRALTGRGPERGR